MHLRMDYSSRREIGLFVFCLVLMSLLYSTPKLFSQGFTWDYLKELGVDCCLMAIACLPVWYLHFKVWAEKPMQQRFAWHLLTAFVYYGFWVLLYQVYNRGVGLPPMSARQAFQNIGPNLLFYIQVFSSLHIDLFIRERERQFQRERALLAWGHKAEINALKAQIQPHFLFNTLNSISASVSGEQERTRVLIGKLAETFRYALRSTKQDLVHLSAELDFIRAYLLLEQERFGARLNYRIDSDCPRTKIPPMLLQPLVENAIKHGVEPSITGGVIQIRCVEKGDNTRIEITNTGRPFTGTVADLFSGEGVGLSNTAKRLNKHFGEELEVIILPEGGLTLRFNLPAAN